MGRERESERAIRLSRFTSSRALHLLKIVERLSLSSISVLTASALCTTFQPDSSSSANSASMATMSSMIAQSFNNPFPFERGFHTTLKGAILLSTVEKAKRQISLPHFGPVPTSDDPKRS